MEVGYRPHFVRRLKALERDLQDEAIAAIKRFEDSKNHRALRVHALRGKLKRLNSFSVNYRYRIVFEWVGKGKRLAALADIGDHDVYR